MEPQSTHKHWFKALGLVLLAAIIIVSILRDAIVNQPWREISVTGRGTVEYVPDTARVTLGVNIESANAQSALTQLDATMSRIVPAIEALGIARENISTQNLSVYPQYYYPESAPSMISGYVANQNITVEIAIASSSNDVVGKVIQTASAQGANQVLSVTFDASNINDLKQEAVIKAITDAKSRAQAVADAADVELGNVTGWWENVISVPGQPMPYYDGYGGGEMGMGGMGGGNIVPSGTSEVIMEVSLNFETE
jgi:uncharacterized protein YggE